MLPQNFQVGRQILSNIAKNSFSIFHFSKNTSKDGKLNWSESKMHLTPVQYQRKLKQCFLKPKPLFAQLCCKKLFSKPNSKKCDATTAGDDYLKARESLKLRIENLVKFVKNESQSITSNVETSLKSSNAAHAIQMEKLFRATSNKLDKLISLDVSYGNWMRKETLLLNDEIKRSFDALKRAITANAKNITYMLKNLQSDVTRCVECAQRNLLACRKHNAPSNLTECTKKQLDEATKKLEQMNKEVRLKLKEITNLRERVMKAHEMTAQEVIEVNHKKVTELVKNLERCILQLKRSNK